MAESLNDNETRNTDDAYQTERDSEDRSGFWDSDNAIDKEPQAEAQNDDVVTEPEGDVVPTALYEPEWADENVLKEGRNAEDHSGGGVVPSWLSLSRVVDAHTRRSERVDEGQDLASLFPKVRGGRVIVRGPVDGSSLGEEYEGHAEYEEPLHVDDQDTGTSPMPMAELDPVVLDDARPLYTEPSSEPVDVDVIPDHRDDFVVEAPRANHMPESGRWSNRFEAFGDLDEPVLFQPEETHEPTSAYLPSDVYTEESPYEAAQERVGQGQGEDESGPKDVFGHIWLDGVYEQIDESETEPEPELDEPSVVYEPAAGLPSEAVDEPDSEMSFEPVDEPAATAFGFDDEAETAPSSFVESEYHVDYDEDYASSFDEELLEDDYETDEAYDFDIETDAVDVSAYEDAAPAPRSLLIGRIMDPANRKAIIIGVSIAAAILIVVYVVGVVKVSGKFLPNTGIGSCNLSGLTQQEAEQALIDATQNYKLTVSCGDFSTTIDGATVSVDRDEARIAKEAFDKQNPFLWPIVALFHSEPDIDQAITYDNVKFDQELNEAIDAFHQSTLPADNASVKYNDKTQLYTLEGTVDGKALQKDKVLTAAHTSVSLMRTSANLSPASAMRDAQVSDLPQYEQSVENANTVRQATIPITLEGKQIVLCDPILIRSWVTVSDDPAVKVDTAALKKWTEDVLSPLVYEDGEWGELFLDVDRVVASFTERLKNGETGAFEVFTYDEPNREGTSRQKAYEESPWKKELGRYIDVDLNAQFARFFDSKGNVIWESAFVSGDQYAGHQTVTGTYKLYDHALGQVLVGLDYDGDGKPDYESYVNFWMPFYGGYGLHDATWRDDFGGDLYMYNGSHGCINLPYEKAEELYNMTNVGTTVYVHE